MPFAAFETWGISEGRKVAVTVPHPIFDTFLSVFFADLLLACPASLDLIAGKDGSGLLVA